MSVSVKKALQLFTATAITVSSAFTTAPTKPTAFHRLTSRAISSTTHLAMSSDRYTIPDQPARFARAKAEDNRRYLDIETVYDPSYLKGKRVAVTGANRGIGLALAKELTAQGGRLVAICRSSSAELDALNPEEVVTGIDVTSDEACDGIAGKVTGGPIDILINNAGYFYEPEEKIDSVNYKEDWKMIDICALGPLRVSSNLVNAGLLEEGSRIAIITSQGGSVTWRTTQNPTGGDYGHHMSKAAANMMSVLLAQEMKGKKIAVGILHPGFNKTEMTAKYAEIWEVEGAVDSSVGAKRVFHEIGLVNMETTGKFINCEDGLEIPW